MKNKKGFTLIELLAVIVILALLVLIAVPAVTRIMTSASKNSFKNEVTAMISDFNKAYTEKMNKEVISTGSTCDSSKTSVYNITSGGVGYSYMCMTLNDLVNEQVIKKNLGQSYGGYIQMWVPDSGQGQIITFANITNGRYFIQGRESEISKSDFSASQTAYSGNEIQKPTQEVKCPTDCGRIPASSVMNKQDNGNNNNNNINDDNNPMNSTN